MPTNSHRTSATFRQKFLAEAKILGIGFSLSGYLLADQSISSPWFPLLQNIPNLANVFSEKLDYPCHIENNINTVALGEYYSGLWNDIEDMVVISLDFGIGAGIISQGKLIRGGFGNAGEVAYCSLMMPSPKLEIFARRTRRVSVARNLMENPQSAKMARTQPRTNPFPYAICHRAADPRVIVTHRNVATAVNQPVD